MKKLLTSRIWRGRLLSTAGPTVAACIAAIPFLVGVPVWAQSAPQPRYEGPSIGELDIFAAPDNLQLNLNYARQQVSKGDYLGAASALERMLLAQPDWHSARLFYAAVLFRLNDKDAALSQLGMLERQNLTEAQLATLVDYKAAFQKVPGQIAGQGVEAGRAVSSDSPFSGFVAAGLRYDIDAANALNDVFSAIPERDDISLFATGQIKTRAPISSNGDLSAHGRVGGYIRGYNDFDDAGYSVASVAGGLTFEQGNIKLIGELLADKVNLNEERYLVQIGPRAVLTFSGFNGAYITLRGTAYDQDYSALDGRPNERLRSGEKTDLRVIAGKSFSPQFSASLWAGIEDKSAQEENYGYEGIRLGGALSGRFKGEYRYRLTATHRALDFNEQAGSFVTPRGEEARLNARASLSLPLSGLLKDAKSFDGGFVELAANYNSRDVEISDQNYESLGAELRLGWTF